MRVGYKAHRGLSEHVTPPLWSPGSRLSFSTDTFVVQPLFFPGGNIGHLAVCGTVNDVATAGAVPLWLSVGFVLEEGFPVNDLRRILHSMADVAAEAGVQIVTGDTKVVEAGAADGIFINTAGIGVMRADVALSAANCRPGDAILLSGSIGDHGICIISQREGLTFSTDIESDAAPLAQLCAAVLDVAGDTRCFRDPTRGGLASALNEIAAASGVGMLIDEDSVPVKDQVRGACEMLGFDVFQVANEGKMIAVVPQEQAEAALAAMRETPYGADAAIIGQVTDGVAGRVNLRNAFGATRIMDMLVGEQLPRIC
ncbi:MAG: hydrogenase expression/formation protein HypE [Actinomycetes bacterium]|nr:hydrogenase expression/formation protein HypE [Actinomycetes bacterium]